MNHSTSPYWLRALLWSFMNHSTSPHWLHVLRTVILHESLYQPTLIACATVLTTSSSTSDPLSSFHESLYQPTLIACTTVLTTSSWTTGYYVCDVAWYNYVHGVREQQQQQKKQIWVYFLLLCSCFVPSVEPFFAFPISPLNWPDSLALFLRFSFCLTRGM